ncbi:MAG TPA: VOC family protein [Ktedonosporobacter sp.]|jgi:catechol 2,3-dioxygenase|nr:VOC family protein [Ktedonosporobacter sp.]
MQQQSTSQSIHPDTRIGTATLRVAQLDRSLHFYEDVLGFRRLEQTSESVVIGAEDMTPLLILTEEPGAQPQPRQFAGVYHIAILLPGRAELGQLLARMIEAGIEIGQGDHLVSEALYISDPDAIGLELYRDRPRDTWNWSEERRVQMASNRVDLEGMLAEGEQSTHRWTGLPAGTRIGHMHLRVGDIAQAEHFYHTILGFDITAQVPGALFVSAGGYHHHIGLNTWESRGAGPAPAHTAGLSSFEVLLPDRKALEEVQARLTAAQIPFQEDGTSITVADPWQNRMTLHI